MSETSDSMQTDRSSESSQTWNETENEEDMMQVSPNLFPSVCVPLYYPPSLLCYTVSLSFPLPPLPSPVPSWVLKGLETHQALLMRFTNWIILTSPLADGTTPHIWSLYILSLERTRTGNDVNVSQWLNCLSSFFLVHDIFHGHQISWPEAKKLCGADKLL